MNLGLRMHHHFYFLRRKIKQPTGLDYLKTFVHERGRIDGNSLPHPPGWMIQGLLWCYKFEIRLRSFAKWPARRGQDEFRHLTAQSGSKTLVGAVVFAIHW